MSIAGLMIMIPAAFAYELDWTHPSGEISNWYVDVGHNYFTVSWRNVGNETIGRVYYGPTKSVAMSVGDSGYGENHTINVTGLSASSTYYYEIEAVDQSGLSEKRTDTDYYSDTPTPYSINTEVEPDTTAPNVSTISIVHPSDTSTTVSWITDETADSNVYYGTSSGNLDQYAGSDSGTTSHSVTLEGLTADTLYYYKVSSCDGSQNCANSTVKKFLALEDSQQPFLETSLSGYHNSWTIEFTGQTKALAEIRVYVNGIWQRFTYADEDGNFTVTGVALSQSASPNVVKVLAIDQSLNEVYEEYELYQDFDAPTLNITQFNTTSTSGTMTIKGFVDELCEVVIDVSAAQDSVMPQQVENLNATATYTNSVELEWDPVSDEDIYVYAIYRDGTRIETTTGDIFTDSALDSNETYSYYVTAFDSSCNEGPASNTVSVTTESGGSVYGLNATTANVSCNDFSYTDSFNISGSFTSTISLEEGTNYVTIKATDKGGSTASYEGSVYYDISPPEIIDTNLANFNGQTYDRDIKIKGNVTESATCYAYINNATSASASTETTATNDSEVHYFELEVTLSRDVEHDASTSSGNGSVMFKSGSSWDNTISIVCVDSVGQNDTVTETIVYALCSTGSWFRTDMTALTPDIATPRLVIMGIQEFGLGLNLTWQGSTDYNATITDINLVYQNINEEDKDKWDEDLVSSLTKSCNANKTQCWLGIKMKAIDPSNGENWTWYEKEENISDHRKGSGDCETTSDAIGCYRFPLQLEIEFQVPSYSDTYTQRQCWDVEVGIDARVDPGVLPEAFLEDMVRLLAKLIKLIDRILKPLKKIEKFVIYACLITWVILFTKAWSKRGVCEVSQISTVASGGTPFTVEIAGYGDEACVDAYGGENKNGDDCGDKNTEKCDNCQTCAAAIKDYKEFENTMQWLCDRIFCPTAPTFRNYVESSGSPTQGNLGIKRCELGSTNSRDGWCPNTGYEWAELASTDPKKKSSLKVKATNEATTESTDDRPKREELRALAETYGNAKSTTDCAMAKIGSTNDYFIKGTSTEGSALSDYEKSEENECSELHYPTAECCPYEYMQKYDSVCGLPEGNLFDELKESACIEAQALHDTDALGELSCNTVWNSVAGFCDPEGNAPADFVPSTVYINQDTIGREQLYMKVVDPENSATGDWIIEPGYVSTKIEGASSTVSSGTDAGKHNLGDTPVQQDTYFISLGSNNNMKDLFIDENKQIKKVNEVCGQTSAQCNAFCSQFQSGPLQVTSGSQTKLWRFCQDVHAKLGSGKTQVVDPTSGLLRAAQCLCLPAVKTYLSFYRSMAVAVRNCFQTILLTGDGSSGMCQAVLTVYVCDLIWDLIRCFSKKFGSSVAGTRDAGPFTMLTSQITGAGDDVSSSLSGRYGDTAPWRAMFSEKKIVHALCLWAFTGTWDLDLTSFFEGNFTVPIESQGLLYPCERRFVSFDPATSPSGKTTYLYHIGAGLVAGADLTNVHLELVCSNGVCDTTQGYSDGKCDCRNGEQKMDAGWSGVSGTMSAGDVLSEDIYVQQTGYRYDKAALSWTYVDNEGKTVTQSTNCTMTKAGPDEPAYCSYSLVSMMYLCSLGGEECTGYFSGDPSLDEDYNYVGKTLRIVAPIAHGGSNSSTDTKNQCTKFIGIKVKNTATNKEVVIFRNILNQIPPNFSH